MRVIRESDDLAGWRKATASNPYGDCVQLMRLGCGHIVVRNSRDPEGPRVGFTPAEIRAFLDGVKRGEFDDLGVD